MKVEITVRVYEDSWPYATLAVKQSAFKSDYLGSLQIGFTVQKMLGNAVLEAEDKLAKQEEEVAQREEALSAEDEIAAILTTMEEAGIEGDPTTPRPPPRH